MQTQTCGKEGGMNGKKSFQKPFLSPPPNTQPIEPKTKINVTSASGEECDLFADGGEEGGGGCSIRNSAGTLPF